MKLKYEEMPLPSRDFLIDRLNQPDVSIASTKWDSEDFDKDCGICCSPMMDPQNLLDDSHRHPFELRCGHCFCKQCVRTWMSSNYGCPMCRQDFFRESTFSFDVLPSCDAEYIMDLRQAVLSIDTNTKVKTTRAIWAMAKHRATLFERGEYNAELSAYRDYKSPRGTRRLRILDRPCRVSTMKLAAVIYTVYLGSVLMDFDGDSRKNWQGKHPSLRKHPLAMMVCSNMMTLVKQLCDGQTMTPKGLRQRLVVAYMNSAVHRLAQKLTSSNTLPDGFDMFVEDLREKIMEAFDHYTEWFPTYVKSQ